MRRSILASLCLLLVGPLYASSPSKDQIIAWLLQERRDEVAQAGNAVIPTLLDLVHQLQEDPQAKETEPSAQAVRLRGQAIRSLGTLATPESLAALHNLLQDPQFFALTKEGVRPIGDGLYVEVAVFGGFVAMAKNLSMREEAIKSVRQYLPHPHFRAEAIRTLGIIGDKGSIPLLRPMLSQGKEDRSTKAEAAATLAQLGDDTVLPYLINLVNYRWEHPEDLPGDFSNWGYRGLSYLAKTNPAAVQKLRADFLQHVPRVGEPAPDHRLSPHWFNIDHLLRGLVSANALDNALLEPVVKASTHTRSVNILISALGELGNYEHAAFLQKLLKDDALFPSGFTPQDREDLRADAQGSLERLQMRRSGTIENR